VQRRGVQRRAERARRGAHGSGRAARNLRWRAASVGRLPVRYLFPSWQKDPGGAWDLKAHSPLRASPHLAGGRAPRFPFVSAASSPLSGAAEASFLGGLGMRGDLFLRDNSKSPKALGLPLLLFRPQCCML
jgi:hypothetical protein